MKTIHLFIALIISFASVSQTSTPVFNFDFEQNYKKKKLPDNWGSWGECEIKRDSLNVYSGKYSVSIKSDSEDTFGNIIYSIPANYEGNYITFSGYIKIKDVKDYAGLFLRTDSKFSILKVKATEESEIKGTIDWKEYSITIPLSENAETIYIAGKLFGSGQAWFDDFKVSIDGKDIQSLKQVEKKIYKATLDNEFDKGSMFHIVEHDSMQLSNLYKLGKIWGFLKYHHPEIAKGNLNWDYELFRILSSVNSDDFDIDINSWITGIGELNKRKRKPGNPEAKIRPDISWIANTEFLHKDICESLNKIHKSKPSKENYYIDFNAGIRNPIFKNENPYKKMYWGDTGYKVLALFRYWNMIEYFFPYKYLIEKDWDDVLKEYLPKLIETEGELEYKLLILSLIGEIHDTHANMYWINDNAMDQFFGVNLIPVEIGYVDYKFVVVRTFSQLESNSKISVGDEIIRIGGVGIDDVYASKIDYCPASNEPTKMRNLSLKLSGTNGNFLALTFKNESKTQTEWLQTYPKNEIDFNSTKQTSHRILGEDIGYIYPAKLKPGEIHEIMKLMMDKKGIIVDMRCYPSDFIVFGLGEYLNPKPVEFAKLSKGSLENPGEFDIVKMVIVGQKNNDYYKGKVVVLVNEKTQSQAEYTTMALRVSPNAIVIGSTTAGADGNVSKILLPGYINTGISGIGVYYPDGTETQRIGIVPDIEIKPTLQGIIDGRDEVLEKGIEVITAWGHVPVEPRPK